MIEENQYHKIFKLMYKINKKMPIFLYYYYVSVGLAVWIL